MRLCDHGPILIIGAGGMLGREVTAYLQPRLSKSHLVALQRMELDVTDQNALEWRLNQIRPVLVINCAAYTDVDGCESHYQLAQQVNAIAPSHLAKKCRKLGIFLVHYSTDYVFDGCRRSPYREDDPTNPLTQYGKSKREGEAAIMVSGCSYLIIRTSWLFGLHGRNFVETILARVKNRERLTVVSDQVGCPTLAKDLAEATVRLVDARVEGIVHFANSGKCSRHGFACEILRRSNLDWQVEAVSSDELKRPARRPAYSVLSLEKFQSMTGTVPRLWTEALSEYLRQRV